MSDFDWANALTETWDIIKENAPASQVVRREIAERLIITFENCGADIESEMDEIYDHCPILNSVLDEKYNPEMDVEEEDDF